MAQGRKALQQLIQTSQNIIGTQMSAQSPKETKRQHKPQPQSAHLQTIQEYLWPHLQMTKNYLFPMQNIREQHWICKMTNTWTFKLFNS